MKRGSSSIDVVKGPVAIICNDARHTLAQVDLCPTVRVHDEISEHLETKVEPAFMGRPINKMDHEWQNLRRGSDSQHGKNGAERSVAFHAFARAELVSS